jgi:hypothetical protein
VISWAGSSKPLHVTPCCSPSGGGGVNKSEEPTFRGSHEKSCRALMERGSIFLILSVWWERGNPIRAHPTKFCFDRPAGLKHNPWSAVEGEKT